jgi:hypothetical protein
VSGSVSLVFVYKSPLNTAAPLSNCTAVVQCVVMFFLLWSAGMKTFKIYKRMSTQYGEQCMAQKNVYKWVDRFKCARTTADDEE